jgi:predicted DNA binding CopG/RHH family protein
MEKPIKSFTKEYLARCAKMTPEEILEFLENYRMVVANLPENCKPVGLKIEHSLINAFKQKAKLEGIHYQTKIKQLMREWLIS